MIDPFELHHRAAREVLATGAPVFLTVNPVEFHGPHLPLHNDRLISRGLAVDLHARLYPEPPLLLAADLEVGVEPCPGPGTRPGALPQVRRAVVAACEALAQMGAQKVVLLTFHGSPLHALAIEAGVQRLRSRGVKACAPFNLLLHALLDEPPETFAGAVQHLDEETRALLIAELETDIHAGFFETSVALHYAPDAVDPRHTTLPPCPPLECKGLVGALSRLAGRLGMKRFAAELRFAAIGLAWVGLRPFPGYTGRPDLADAQAGAAFAELMMERFVPVVRACLEEGATSPGPIMSWLGPLTLGGRIPGFNVPLDAVVPFKA